MVTQNDDNSLKTIENPIAEAYCKYLSDHTTDYQIIVEVEGEKALDALRKMAKTRARKIRATK